MSTVTLVTGGARSGKSTHALELVEAHTAKAFIATAEASDREMEARIEKHRSERGKTFVTIEEPRDLAPAVGRVPAGCSVAVIDCLTVWLGNLMHAHGVSGEYPEIASFLDCLADPPVDLVIVTNELGMGIVPANEMAREFRDRAGRLNQRVAQRADTVILLVSGVPLTIKGKDRT